MRKRGFTLIELLVVIAIIAVLATVVILSLNPAELLKQSRDSNRISDLATLKTSIGLYLAAVSSPSIGTAGTCYESGSQTTTCPWFSTASTTASATTTRTVNSQGWLPIDFTAMSSGAPIGSLPIDPINTTSTSQIYSYAMSGLTFKLAANLESTKYGTIESTDGGTSSGTYEQGTNLSL